MRGWSPWVDQPRRPGVARTRRPLLVCVLEGIAGWLWSVRRAGAVPALALVPVGAVFWCGFALPIPPILAIVRTALN